MTQGLLRASGSDDVRLPTQRQVRTLETHMVRALASWSQVTAAAASAMAGVTELSLMVDGQAFGVEGPGVPVAAPVEVAEVAVSWLADSAPSGDWSLALLRRQPGGTFQTAATFAFHTS